MLYFNSWYGQVWLEHSIYYGFPLLTTVITKPKWKLCHGILFQFECFITKENPIFVEIKSHSLPKKKQQQEKLSHEIKETKEKNVTSPLCDKLVQPSTYAPKNNDMTQAKMLTKSSIKLERKCSHSSAYFPFRMHVFSSIHFKLSYNRHKHIENRLEEPLKCTITISIHLTSL